MILWKKSHSRFGLVIKLQKPVRNGLGIKPHTKKFQEHFDFLGKSDVQKFSRTGKGMIGGDKENFGEPSNLPAERIRNSDARPPPWGNNDGLIRPYYSDQRSKPVRIE